MVDSKKGRKNSNLRVNSLNIISSLSYISIPIQAFHKYPLAVLETITVYLKEECNLNYSEIGILLNRDQRNIWTVYKRAQKKLESKANSAPKTDAKTLSSYSYISIPTEIFRKYPLAVLESIVTYLKDERHLNYHEIAVLLNRDQRNIWTVYKRAERKLHGKK